jgi:hypothetical protein
MIPNAHINEGQLTITFFENELNAAMFEGNDIAVLRDGYCIRDIVAKQRFTKIFHESTWELLV